MTTTYATPAPGNAAEPSVDKATEAPLELIEAGTMPYRAAWDWQRELHAARRAGERADTVVLLEHPSVYTAGKRTAPEDRPRDGIEVIEVDRGGMITWHGPGQLVGYPILELPAPLDVVAYVRRIEQVLIDTCADLGLATERIAGRSGVWVPGTSGAPDRKVAAIGVRVSYRVTLHGFALNCDPDLAAFDQIVPCGLSDTSVTSLTAELGRTVTVADVLPIIRPRLAGLR